MPGKCVVFKHIEIILCSCFHRRLSSMALNGLNGVSDMHLHNALFCLALPRLLAVASPASVRYGQKLERCVLGILTNPGVKMA